MTAPATGRGAAVVAVQRMVAVIELLARKDQATIEEISAATALSRAGVFRLLRDMRVVGVSFGVGPRGEYSLQLAGPFADPRAYVSRSRRANSPATSPIAGGLIIE